LPEYLIRRVKSEKREKTKWYDKPVRKECRISNDDITQFVLCLKECVFTAIFSKSNHSDAKQAFQYLTFLRGELMLPPLIERVYASLESLIEPHRYTSILSCLLSVSREIVTFNKFHETQTQLHVLPLITAVLPGLDANDSNKCCLTLQFLQNVFDCIVVCDCSPAVNYRSDLTEHERELCFETSKFEDYVHEFFKR
jgi:proteasome activator subunit 4